MPSQPADGGRICTTDRTATPPGLDVPLRHVQAWLEQPASARGLFGVCVVAILALLAVSTWTSCCSVPIDTAALAQHRNSGPTSHLFEAGAPGHSVTAIQYKVVSD